MNEFNKLHRFLSIISKKVDFLPVVFSFFYILNLLALPLSAFDNPFLVKGSYVVEKIVNVKANRNDVGFIDSPNGVLVHFNMLERDGAEVPDLDGGDFSYFIRKKNSQYTIKKTFTKYTKDGYFSKLLMPVVKQDGFYDLIIKYNGLNQNSIIKIVPNLFKYSVRKVDLFFLIDNSGSMARTDPKNLRYQAVYKILKKLEFSQKVGSIAVISFSDTARVIFPLGKVQNFLKSKIKFYAVGNTDFRKPFNVLENMIKNKLDQSPNQKAIVFLTDGTSNYPYNNEHLRVYSLGIPIYTVGLSANYQKNKEYNPAFLQRISRETRGHFFEASPNVIEDVFRKLIILSSSEEEEFVVFPLKEKYAYNELINIHYRSSKKYQKDLNVKIYLNDKKKSELEIYSQDQEKISLYPIQGSSFREDDQNNSTTETIHWIDLVFRHKNKIIYKNKASIVVDMEPEVVVEGYIYFEQIDFLNHDIRYFTMKNRSKDNIFVDIVHVQSDQNFPRIVFNEVPFFFPKNKREQQTVIFHPFSPSDFSKDYVLDFVIKTSRGDYLNQINFDFISRFKPTMVGHIDQKSFFIPRTIFFFVLIILNIFLVFLLSIRFFYKKTR